MIKHGIADVILAGGVEAFNCEVPLAGYSSMGVLSRRREDPKRASRPFDKDRDGLVIGEGAAILVLESLVHAKSRGVRIHAEVLGYGRK
jgi:3-oxoacyl-(acyl-carrier-protein) synthase